MSPAQRPRILVIDDEVLIGSVIRRMLAADYDVVPVTSAADALRAIATLGPFDLVLCDLMMPEMSGMELHAELQRQHPDIARRMVFLTGGAFTLQAREFLEHVGNARLEKPFDSTRLRAMVAELVPVRAASPSGRQV